MALQIVDPAAVTQHVAQHAGTVSLHEGVHEQVAPGLQAAPVQGADLAILPAHDDQFLVPEVDGKKIPRRGNHLLMGNREPAGLEHVLDFRLEKSAAVVSMSRQGARPGGVAQDIVVLPATDDGLN